MFEEHPMTFPRECELRRQELTHRLAGDQTPVRRRPAVQRWPLRRFLRLHAAKRLRIPPEAVKRVSSLG